MSNAAHPAPARLGFVAALALVVSACDTDGADRAEDARLDDPAIIASLNEPLMIDRDLASLNEANAALTTGARWGALPAHVRSSQVADKAREEAATMLRRGGSEVAVPEPTPIEGVLPLSAGLTLVQKAQVLGLEQSCLAAVSYTPRWAADMPAEFPIYPMGNVEDAAGADKGNCALRLVQFVTPVAPEDVQRFYYTRVRQSGYPAELTSDEKAVQLAAYQNGSGMAALIEELPWGGSRVTLLTSST